MKRVENRWLLCWIMTYPLSATRLRETVHLIPPRPIWAIGLSATSPFGF